MRSILSVTAAAALITASAAFAQTATTTAPAGTTTAPASPGTSGPTGSSNNAVNAPGNAPSGVNASGTTNLVAASALERGANSFTEGQARTRIEAAGFSNVTGLAKDDQGIWRGQAMRGGQSVQVGFDYKGNIAVQ